MRGGGILDNISPDDIVFAFFPCTQFTTLKILTLNGEYRTIRNKSIEDKIRISQREHNKLNEYFNHFANMCLWAYKNKIKLIIENPYQTTHYLNLYFPLKSVLIDKNRWQNGDSFVKPTQYWFLNFEPQNNLFMVTQRSYIKKVESCSQVMRSMISREYAEFFVKTFIL